MILFWIDDRYQKQKEGDGVDTLLFTSLRADQIPVTKRSDIYRYARQGYRCVVFINYYQIHIAQVECPYSPES